jgi:membrane-bound lytic murein transglycosylase A
MPASSSGRGPWFGTWGEWRPLCRALAATRGFATPDEARAWIEARFRPYRAVSRGGDGGRHEGLFTGYFEIEIAGALTADARHRYPIYRRPDDLVMVDLGEFRPQWRGESIAGRVRAGRLRPYDDRAAIETGSLAGRGLEIAWAADPADLFFLHIQGSGRIQLPDGRVFRVGYDGHNGYPYHSIGTELAARGMKGLTADAIAAWIRAHPEEGDALMKMNARYIFFRELEGEGPVGAEGVPLTPGRSLAVDPAFYPYGIPLWLDTTAPLAAGTPLRRLMVAQDTGAAIKGPLRGDIFWGHGPAARREAGAMKNPGALYVLLPLGVDPKPPTTVAEMPPR